MGQRPEAERPVVAKLLADGCSKVGCLEMSSLCFGSFEAGSAVVGGVEAVASVLDGPNRETVRDAEGSSLRWKSHSWSTEGETSALAAQWAATRRPTLDLFSQESVALSHNARCTGPRCGCA